MILWGGGGGGGPPPRGGRGRALVVLVMGRLSELPAADAALGLPVMGAGAQTRRWLSR